MHDRDFLDGYANRAPGEVRADVVLVRRFLDAYAAAAGAAGIQPGTAPTFAQLEKILRQGPSLGSLDQDKVPGSIRTLEAWAAGGCSGKSPAGTTPSSTSPTTTAQNATAPGATTEATPSGGQTTPSKASDCANVNNVVYDISIVLDSGHGFSYLRDRDFLDGYTDRAPADTRDSVRLLRDLLDRYASAAQAAGVAPENDPLPDQADKIKAALHLPLSGSELSDLQRALQTLNA